MSNENKSYFQSRPSFNPILNKKFISCCFLFCLIFSGKFFYEKYSPLILSVICFIQQTSAQIDSSVIYLNKEGKETTRDSAFIYAVFTRNNNMWHGKVYYPRSQVLQSEGNYSEMNFKTPVGSFNNYKEDALDNTSIYSDGKITEKTYYYKNGGKKSHIVYSSNGISEEKGWDENGKEVPNFIVEREARFKGGAEAWGKYLSKHLNSNVPIDAGAPAGDYAVQVEFLVNKEGYITEAKAVSVPPKVQTMRRRSCKCYFKRTELGTCDSK